MANVFRIHPIAVRKQILSRCVVMAVLFLSGRWADVYKRQVRAHPPITTEAMQTLMEELKESYDYILVDSPAGIDSGFDLAVCAADKAVVVTTPQVAAVHDADCVLRLLRRRKDIST